MTIVKGLDKTTRCSRCGEGVEAWTDGEEIVVQPCQVCLDDQAEKVEESYEDWVDPGRLEEVVEILERTLKELRIELGKETK